MRAPFRLSVRLPDGHEYPVSSITFNRAGDVTRITTFIVDGRTLGMWYDIQGDDLELVTLIVFTPSEGEL